MTTSILEGPGSSRAPSGDSPTVGQLVQSAAAGDLDAWERLFEGYDGLVRAIARSHRLTGDDVDDVAQTAWLRAFERVDQLHDAERFVGWLVTIARREALRTVRAAARVVPLDEGMLAEEPDVDRIDARILAEERDTALWRAFGALPRRHQALLRMLLSEPSPSYEQVGSTLDMPVGSIGPTRGRALERLRRDAELTAVAAG